MASGQGSSECMPAECRTARAYALHLALCHGYTHGVELIRATSWLRLPMAGVAAPVSLSPKSWAEYGGHLNFALGPQIAGDLSSWVSQISMEWKQRSSFAQVRAWRSEGSD